VKTPARPPRNEPTLEKYTYYDSEVVVQPNGERAAFTWSSKKKELGWVFNHWEDEAGFVLLPLEGRDDKFAQLLIDSECDDERRSIKHPPEPKKPVEIAEADNKEQAWLNLIKQLLKPHEVLKQYSYGGVMSGRGGYFVINECDPTKVLRYRQTWLS
jgi:hypothetical protein